MSLFQDRNISVLSLPLYYILSTFPHGYAIYTASGGNILKWDNRNPRSGGLKDGLRKKLGDEIYARYERAEAAHYNSLESIPIFFAAVTLANVARLPTHRLNTFVIGSFVLRALYQIVYIRTSRPGNITLLRTLIWYIQTGWGLHVLWQAGKALA